MSWQDERKPASFRGLEFEARSLTRGGGNALVVDKIPESDDHTVGELGNEPDTYRLTGFVHGDDHLDQFGSLETAFRKRGAGELVHPWRGQLLVFVKTWTVTHDISGGVSEFEIEFVPAGLETRPFVLVITETDVYEKGETAKEKALARLALFDSDAPTWLETTAGVIDIVDGLPSYYDSTITAARAAELASFARFALVEIEAPAELTDLVTAVETACESSTLQGLVRYLTEPTVTDLPTGATAPGEAVRQSVDAYIRTVRVTSLVAACNLAVDESYNSADAAEEQQAVLCGIIDDELDLEPEDETFTALADLRAALVAALSEVSQRLPRLREIVVNEPTPALVLAFDLYEDVERESEVLELNGNAHPGFLSGTLQVLS